jgi:hypothetical protein
VAAKRSGDIIPWKFIRIKDMFINEQPPVNGIPIDERILSCPMMM